MRNKSIRHTKQFDYLEVTLMTREELAILCDARDKLCDYCESDECEKCIVTALIDDAYNETPEEELE